MKLCSFERGDDIHLGLVRDDCVVDVTATAQRLDASLPTTLLGWLRHGEGALETLARLDGEVAADDVFEVAGAVFSSPLPDLPRSALCVAANYRDHVMEAVAAAAERGQVIDPDAYLNAPPSYFTKDPRAMCGPFDDIVLEPSYSTMVDWEVELAVVIGAVAEDVAEETALDHVFGYAVFNDVSVRDVQRERGQMWKGKNLRRASPLGPYIVTADEVDPRDLLLQCWVSGELMQKGSTGSMIHGIPSLIADLSRGFRLEPGDVIATGTTVGTGHSRNPQRFLTAGDVLETEIAGLGRQRNAIV